MTKEQRQVLEYLLLQYIDGKSSRAEEKQLFTILRSKQLDPAKLEELMEELMAGEPAFTQYKPEEWQKVLNTCVDQSGERRKVQVVTRPFIFRWVAAAAVIALVVLGGFWLLTPPKKPVEHVSTVVAPQDISSPVTSSAILTLSDGKQVFFG